MELVIKASALAITGAMLGLVIKKHTPDMSLLLSLAVCCLVLYLALDLISDIIGFLTELSELAELKSAELGTVLKAVGIAAVSKFGASVCAEAGQSSAAVSVELLGAVAALYTSLPLMRTVMDMVVELL